MTLISPTSSKSAGSMVSSASILPINSRVARRYSRLRSLLTLILQEEISAIAIGLEFEYVSCLSPI